METECIHPSVGSIELVERLERPEAQDSLTVVANSLANGLLSHLNPGLDSVRTRIDELVKNQTVLLEATQQELTQVQEYSALEEVDSLFRDVKVYHAKLVNIKKEMRNLQEQVEKSKVKAQRLQIQKQKEELHQAHLREKEMKHEEKLTARPAKPPT